MESNIEDTLPKTRSFWQRQEAGKSYDKEFGGIIGAYVNKSELEPLTALLGELRNKKILDVGCGTGRHLALAHSSNTRQGVDLSQTMLDEAQAKMPDGIFTVASADKLPFPDNSFDLVISSRVLQHIRKQQNFVTEMSRVCKPGGQVIILSYNSWSGLCLYKQIRLSKFGKILNIPFKLILGKRSFFNPWGFDYDNYVSIPELSGFMKQAGLTPKFSWGVTGGMPWFWNDFFIGKILERVLPFLVRAYFNLWLFLDRTIMKLFPFKFFTDKIIVAAEKK